MAGGDEFDLTRGGEEDERKAPVLSLRRRGRLTPPPGTHPANGAHRHLAARVQVPLTAPVKPAAETRPPTLGWNQPPDAPGPAPLPAAQADPQARSTLPRSARTPHRAIALAIVLLTALISTVAVIITTDQTSSGARAQAPTAATDNAALFPTLTLAGQLAGEIDKLSSPIKRHGRRGAHS